jgi:hypothetical protein
MQWVEGLLPKSGKKTTKKDSRDAALQAATLLLEPSPTSTQVCYLSTHSYASLYGPGN